MFSFVLDALLIVICIIVITVSHRQGFVRTILSLCSSVAAVFISSAFTPTVSSLIYDKFMLSAISKGVADSVKSLVPSGTSEGISELFATMPEALKDLLTRYNVSEESLNEMVSSAANGSIDVQSMSEAIASPVATTISNVLAFILCFIAALIVLKIAIAIIDLIFKLPVLKTLNKFAGILLGIVLAAVIVFVYSEAAVHLVTSLGAVAPDVFGENVINDTIIVKTFSEYNIFGIISDVLKGQMSLSE